MQEPHFFDRILTRDEGRRIGMLTIVGSRKHKRFPFPFVYGENTSVPQMQRDPASVISHETRNDRAAVFIVRTLGLPDDRSFIFRIQKPSLTDQPRQLRLNETLPLGQKYRVKFLSGIMIDPLAVSFRRGRQFFYDTRAAPFGNNIFHLVSQKRAIIIRGKIPYFCQLFMNAKLPLIREQIENCLP